jgi:hypothetical protein
MKSGLGALEESAKMMPHMPHRGQIISTTTADAEKKAQRNPRSSFPFIPWETILLVDRALDLLEPRY